jgi:hypothetical protein
MGSVCVGRGIVGRIVGGLLVLVGGCDIVCICV